MRFLTGAVIAGAAILILAVAVFVRFVAPTDLPPAVLQAPRLHQSAQERSARLSDRLVKLRSQYEGRPHAPRRRELPPRSNVQTKIANMNLPDPDPEDLEDLEEARNTLLNNPDPDERVGAILMLSGAEDAQTLSVLTDAMSDSNAEVRLAAVEAIGDFSDELDPDILRPALIDSSAEVRFEAVGILGDIEKPEALDMVRAALNDPDEDVRSLAEGIIDFAQE
jgi:hypothetical protein